ncbi:MAG TPA: efflux transporter outer membrane subunit [Steroidobacteraceae bacterium]|nr:efflux transporter outer membrane subunit [Steroidobacteraceae bacterium]
MTDINRRRGLTFASLIALIALATLAAALTGCAVGPNYAKPATPVAPQFVEGAAGAYSAEDAQAKFWTQFGDPTLDQLIDEALVANHDLRIALAHLVEARADRRHSQFDLAPTVTASGGYTKQRFPAVSSPTGETFNQQFYDAGFDAFWELDFFGRIRRNIESESAQLEGAEAGLRDAQVSVTAEVARTYFELRGEQARFAVAWRNVENQRATLQLTQARLEAGRSTELDTARAQAQLSATLTTIGPLEASIARSIHRLSVLTGQQPGALRERLAPPRELPALPQMTAVGDPAGLLRRRPDIRVAERQLASSTALVGVAIADLFPKVTFTGSFSYSATTPGQLGTAASRGYVIGPGITWAAFDLGHVRAEIASSRARADAALAGYEQTVLRALEETEDALITHARTRDSLGDAAAAAAASQTAARIARTRYEGGSADFLDVLDAERTQLADEDRLAQSRTDAATSLVAVYKALGGGWQDAPLPRYVRQAGG